MQKRTRLTPEASRLAALEAARALLLETGPQSVTLKAVAAKVGRTHANLLHHFGSASGLQKALAEFIATRVCDVISDAVLASRQDITKARDVVNLAFDAFDTEGAGALASWMLVSGNEDALHPIIERIHEMVDELAETADTQHPDPMGVHKITLSLTLLAMGDAMLGKHLASAIGLPQDTARDTAEMLLKESLTSRQPA